MNKKILTLSLLGFFALTLVSAGVMLYYGQINTTILVDQPIRVGYINENNQTIVVLSGIIEEQISASAGDTVYGKSLRIENFADTERIIKVEQENSVEGITVSIHPNTESPTCLMEGNNITLPTGVSLCGFTIKYTLHPMLESGAYDIKTIISSA